MSVVAVIGLGYVGLPLVVEFGKQVKTIGFDISQYKVDSCLRGVDPSRELEDAQMAEAKLAVYTSDPALLAEADIIIIAVPTPVDNAHIPVSYTHLDVYKRQVHHRAQCHRQPAARRHRCAAHLFCRQRHDRLFA